MIRLTGSTNSRTYCSPISMRSMYAYPVSCVRLKTPTAFSRSTVLLKYVCGAASSSWLMLIVSYTANCKQCRIINDDIHTRAMCKLQSTKDPLHGGGRCTKVTYAVIHLDVIYLGEAIHDVQYNSANRVRRPSVPPKSLHYADGLRMYRRLVLALGPFGRGIQWKPART